MYIAKFKKYVEFNAFVIDPIIIDWINKQNK